MILNRLNQVKAVSKFEGRDSADVNMVVVMELNPKEVLKRVTVGARLGRGHNLFVKRTEEPARMFASSPTQCRMYLVVA